MTTPIKVEQLAEEIVSAANIVSHDGYYELDIDAVTKVLARALIAAEAKTREEDARIAEETAFAWGEVGSSSGYAAAVAIRSRMETDNER